MTWENHDGPNMILDDGGDATLLLQGCWMKAGQVPDPTEANNAELAVILGVARTLKSDPTKWTRKRNSSRVSPKNHHRCEAAYKMAEDNTLLFPASM